MGFIGKQPTPAPLTSSDITDGIISTSKLADTSVTNAKINADLISAETELATAPADTDELLISDAGTLKRIDVSLVGGSNTPAFYVNKSQNQDIAGDQHVQLTWEDEVLDSDNAFASNTFTPQSSGYYFIYAQARFNSNSDADQWRMALYKNGTMTLVGSTVSRTQQTAQVSGLIQLNGSSDNVKFYVYHDLAGNTMTMQNQDEYTYAFGFKVIGI